MKKYELVIDGKKYEVEVDLGGLSPSVLVNGKKVNSQTLKLPSGKILKGEARKIFELERIKTDLKISELR